MGTSTPTQLETTQLEALANRIIVGNCVLVLGPGVSTDSSGGAEVPLNQKFARNLFARDLSKSLSREMKKDLNLDDLRHVSQIWQDTNKNSALLQLLMAKFYKGFSKQTTIFHRDIASLPFQLCITTTPDDLLFEALEQAGKKPTRDFYHFKSRSQGGVKQFNVERPLVYHLYGYHEDPSSLVITENDLIEFLIKIITKCPALPEPITAILSHKDSTCLFVDLGFKNWYLRVLMSALQLLGHSERSVALEPREFFAESKLHQTMVYFSANNTMQFFDESVSEFARRLRAVYESIASVRTPKVPDPPQGAPLAFLSYASEDREFVELLAQKLKAGGVAVWQDKQSLRAGDNWERILTQVIQKQADYVVAVQAPGMARVKGVFYEEIKEALNQQKRVREGFRFLIAVHANDRDRIPELSHLHSISVATDEGVNSLIGSITEDWSSRRALGFTYKLGAATG